VCPIERLATVGGPLEGTASRLPDDPSPKEDELPAELDHVEYEAAVMEWGD